ncbi:LysE family translocator [Salmonella enterica]|nr:LysE family translocator [Salmonella enterica]
MDIEVWLYFTVACFGLAMTPGPNAMLVMAHSVRFGPSIAFSTICGGVLAFILLMVISMFGIDALLKTYPSLLVYIKLLGGAYLIWLGIKQWRERKADFDVSIGSPEKVKWLTLFVQGAISAVSNPKVFLFFGAFLTQFINPQRDIMIQFIIMAATFAFAEFCVEMAINLTAGRFRSYLARNGQLFCMFCGLLFMILGGIVLTAGL